MFSRSPYGGPSRAKIAATLISISMIGLIVIGVWLFVSANIGDVASNVQDTAHQAAELAQNTADDASNAANDAADTAASTAENAANEGQSFLSDIWAKVMAFVTNLAGEAPGVLVGSGLLGALLLVGVFFVIFDDTPSF